ncbi:MAG: PQQ-dependent sugar dehydrogenase [Gammaproteobacteria bacterium]
MKRLFLLIFITLTSCSVGESINVEADLPVETTKVISNNEVLDEIKYYLNEYNTPIQNDLFHVSLENCIDFLGGFLNVECMPPYKQVKEVDIDGTPVNLYKHDDKLYIVLKEGKIFEYDIESEKNQLIFEQEEITNIQEAGLLSIAINKDAKNFAVSYVNSNSELTVDIYKYNKSISDYTFKEKAFAQKVVRPYTHIAGNLIWSEFFQDFLISVGDNKEADASSRFNPAPLNTLSNLGKIISLKNQDLNIPLITNNQNDNKKNIVAYGLRNPWQFFEFKNYLIVFDVGLSINEEMNILNLNEAPQSLGWPIFEGGSKASIIDNISNYEIEINYFKKDGPLDYKDTLTLLTDESVAPKFFYNHFPTEKDYRGAIIGGDIFYKKNSELDLNIASGDITTNEIFLYDLSSGDLMIHPPHSDAPKYTITSIRTINNNNYDLVYTAFQGKLIFIKLDYQN